MYNKVTLGNTNEERMLFILKTSDAVKAVPPWDVFINRQVLQCLFKGEEAKFTKIHQVNLNTPICPYAWGLRK